MSKKLHQDKLVREAIEQLIARNWTLQESGHKYRLLCPCGEGYVRVDGTPRDPANHARRILRDAAKCPDRHELSGQPKPRGAPQ
ncbi:MAG: hypothetical protein LC808_09655 [Actinobacteria bacterium]|nr:hypothetical protein [Actinomycetota bacterium]